ncbi:hypothetical protein ACL02T_10555 [Pseudonocardia sp. RS010]|uniref:hypothetical protein n=1 Tax=Pseudonocardia sp. RS010 TaxID=3385979 RepID=UPI0039A03E55
MKFRRRPGGPAGRHLGRAAADLPEGRQAGSEGYTEPLEVAGPGRAVPRWVKVFVLVAAVLVILLLVVFMTGLGGHMGPGDTSGLRPIS